MITIFSMTDSNVASETFDDSQIISLYDGRTRFDIEAGELFDAVAFFLNTRKEMEEANGK